MEDPEPIRQFTRGVATMKDPPMLPLALWFGTVPALMVLGYGHPVFVLVSFLAAVLATVLALRWFRRTYGVVTPSPDSTLGHLQSGGVAVVVVVFLLEATANAARVPIRLGMIVFGAWLAWGARASGGLRPHLYVLSALCVGLAFVPLVMGQWFNSMLGGAVFLTTFGLGWAYVCVQDYRVLRRTLRHGQART